MTIETADLERRVLAHERILQALVAHIDETEPKLMQRLKASLSANQAFDAHGLGFPLADPNAERFLSQVEARGAPRIGGADSDAKFAATNDDGATMPPSSRATSPID